MYRLQGPNLFLFVPIVIVGVIVTSIIPTHLGETRVLSLFALIIGEIGLSFIPVLALYPKASALQAVLLAIIYFFTTFIICTSSWVISSLGLPENKAFLMKEGEFHINTFALFAANVISLVALAVNFKLMYDEELAKMAHKYKKKSHYKARFRFSELPRPLLRRPDFEKPTTTYEKSKISSTSKKTKEIDFFEGDFEKPFEFEPEITPTEEKLPEESSGKLFAPKIKEEPQISEFFEEEDISSSPFTETLETKPASPFPPSDIKNDLQAIFEQYSSLNAVKKISSSKAEKIYQKKKDIEKRNVRKPYEIPEEKTISAHIEEQDIHEATFRQITEEEKLEEIKGELKKELEKELKEKLAKEEPSKIEEPPKEDLLQNIKEELIETIKVEIKKEMGETKEKKEKTEEIKPEEEIFTKEEIEILKNQLTNLNKKLNAAGSTFMDLDGNTIVKCWQQDKPLEETTAKNLIEYYNTVNKYINNTNQGDLLNLLLESENETITLANIENKILTLCTKETGEIHSTNVLRSLSEIQEA